MTGVHPLRLAEVRRRLALIESYIAIPAPGEDDRHLHATSLGLSVNQFLTLVRVWREHRSAKAISGAGAMRGATRATGPRNLPPESKAAAKDVIDSLGPDVPHVEAVALVDARCAALRIRAPSRSTIWNMVMAARREAARADQTGGLIVSSCHAKLPVELPNGVAFPALILVVDASDGAVLAATFEEDEESVTTVEQAIGQHGAGRQILIDAHLAARMNQPDATTTTPVRSAAARTATVKALGRGFGTIELIYQIVRAAAPERTLRSRKDRPLSQVDARRVLFEQIALHNVARGKEPPIVSWRS